MAARLHIRRAEIRHHGNLQLRCHALRFTDLHRWVTEIAAFANDPKASSEAKLEAIQMAWHEEYQESSGQN